MAISKQAAAAAVKTVKETVKIEKAVPVEKVNRNKDHMLQLTAAVLTGMYSRRDVNISEIETKVIPAVVRAYDSLEESL